MAAVINPPDYDNLAIISVLLNACDEFKDAKKSFGKEAAVALTPVELYNRVKNLHKDKDRIQSPFGKEDMAGKILAIQDKAENEVYDAIQGMAVNTEGTITVRWCNENYIYKCFDGNVENVATLVQDFLGAGIGNICRIVDTTRGGNKFLAKYPAGAGNNPYNFIHAHTPPVDKDPCGKMNLKSAEGTDDEKNIFKQRYFWEQHPGGGIVGNPKIIYYPWTTDADTPNPLYHMYLTRQLNLEYKSVTPEGKMDVELTILSQDRNKITIIDEKTNTAGGFQKAKEMFKKAFNKGTGTELQQIVQASKLNGDVGQVLEAHREFNLINSIINNPPLNSKDFIRMFEAYDFNAVLKAFLERVDIILLHTWKAGGVEVEGAEMNEANKEKNFIVFKKESLANKDVILENLKKNYEYLYEKVAAEIQEYNNNTDLINRRLRKFNEIIDAPLNVDANMNEEQINNIYIAQLKKYVKATVLQKYLPADDINAIADLGPKDVYNIAAAISDIDKDTLINTIKNKIQELNNKRTELVIPSIYTSFNVLNNQVPEGATDLADVDLEKQAQFKVDQGQTKLLIKDIFSKINIFVQIRSVRASALFNLSASFLGIQLIQFVLRNCDKITNIKKKLIQNLYRICKIKDPPAGGAGGNIQKTDSSKNFDKIASLLEQTEITGALTAQEQAEVLIGGRAIKPNTNNQIRLFSQTKKKSSEQCNNLRKSRKIVNRLNNIFESVKPVKKGVVQNKAVQIKPISENNLNIELKYKIKIEDLEINDTVNFDDLYDFLKIYLLETRQILLLYNDLVEEDNENKIKERVETFLTTIFNIGKIENNIYNGGGKRKLHLQPEPEQENENEGNNNSNENEGDNNSNENMNNNNIFEQLTKAERRPINRSITLEDIILDLQIENGSSFPLDELNGTFTSTFCAIEYDNITMEIIEKQNNQVQNQINQLQAQANVIQLQYMTRSQTKKLSNIGELIQQNKAILQRYKNKICEAYDENREWHSMSEADYNALHVGGKRKRKLKIRKTRKGKTHLNKKTKKLRR